ncbi:unnamed protein product, partial [Prorocentrum cordatum]
QYAQFKAPGSEDMRRDGIASYARAEHKLEMDEEMLDRVVAALGLEGEGVPYHKFQQLRNLVIAEKTALREREKKEEEERSRRQAEEKREALEAAALPAKEALSEA